MYYVKHVDKEAGIEIKIPITDENVVMYCMTCCKEIGIDLEEDCREMNGLNLHGTTIYCSDECLKKAGK